MMQQVGNSVITGISAFAATNMDDIVVLMLFFSRVNAQFQRRQIVSGQYLGFTALLLASLPGFLSGFVIPKEWLGLLGLLPIAIGICHLYRVGQDTDEAIQMISYKPNRILSSATYEVAAVTIANGGDNIGVYVPLFANQTGRGVMVIVLVFYGMVGVWCAAAAWLTQHRTIAHLITHYGHAIMPFVLIALGIFIVVDSGMISLLLKYWF